MTTACADSALRLRFPIGDVPRWAAQYAYADDTEVIAIGQEARKRGCYTRDEFLAVAKWKSPRSRHHCERNSSDAIRGATALALRTVDERERIETLTRLHGVSVPTASVLLHLALGSFPIIDFRALWTLGVDRAPAAYTFDCWWAYVACCRALAREAGTTMRMLDRALWAYSKANQQRRGAKDGSASSSTRTRQVRWHDREAATIRADVYARLVATARVRRTLSYSDLPGGRGHIGRYLDAIADYEAANARPPLTAVVVQKWTGLPGHGMAVTLARVGYGRAGEDPLDGWRRALADVFAYWHDH